MSLREIGGFLVYARVRQLQERIALRAIGWGLESLGGYHECVAKC